MRLIGTDDILAKGHGTDHPWQHGPTELISYALEHMHGDTDFDRRLAFLLLDVGVETLFKTYLTLPEEVTGTAMPFGKRKDAAEGNFHELVRGISVAAGTRLAGYNLAHVQFYHDLRNKLYHQGNGVTVPTNQVKSYAELATNLLRVLLDVDLSEQLAGPGRPAPGVPTTSAIASNQTLNLVGSRQPDDDKFLSKKYAPLEEYLEHAGQRGENQVICPFAQIERLLGFSLPASARQYEEWWANHRGNSQAKAWLGAGWLVDAVELGTEQVTFRKDRTERGTTLTQPSITGQPSRAELESRESSQRHVGGIGSEDYEAFFGDLVDRFRRVRPGVIGRAAVTGRSYYAFSAGVSGFRFHWAFTSRGVFQVELYIDVGDRNRNKLILDTLKADRASLDREIGGHLEWERLDDRRGARVVLTQPGRITDPEEHLEELKHWGIVNMVKFIDAFRPRMRSI